jgi:hypothetical protein
VIDTSSVIAVRRRVANGRKAAVFQAMSELVAGGRLVFPSQVVEELERFADPVSPDAQYLWARRNVATATGPATCTFDEVAGVLAVVPDVVDADKDYGVEEADPYVLAAALKLRRQGVDCRIVTEESHDTPTKTSLNTAAGLLGIPAVPLMAFLGSEGIAFE